MFKISDLQIIVLFNPYDSYSKDSKVRTLLSDTFKLKFDGYKAYFPYGVMPVDHLDFISNHVIVCRKTENKMTPLAAWKSLTLDQCNKFKVPFPIAGHLLKDYEKEYKEHIEAIKYWLSDKPAEATAYNFGFTVEPDLEKEMKSELIELGISLLYFYYCNYNFSSVIHGVSNTFKLAHKHYKVGFKDLSLNGKNLCPVRTKAYNNVESCILHMDTSEIKNEYQMEVESKYGQLWKDRLEYGDNNTPQSNFEKLNKVS